MKVLMWALAVLLLTCSPAQALFKGTLQREAWMLEIASASSDTMAVTVYYLGSGLQVMEIITVPAAETVQRVFATPRRGVRRIIIEVDPPANGLLFGQATARIVQGADQFFDVIADLHDARLVFDIE
jgi:hypothetical protein